MSNWYADRWGRFINLARVWWISDAIMVREGYWQVDFKITDTTQHYSFRDEFSAQQFIEKVLEGRDTPFNTEESKQKLIRETRHVGNLL